MKIEKQKTAQIKIIDHNEIKYVPKFNPYYENEELHQLQRDQLQKAYAW
jgi:hypothetical protein